MKNITKVDVRALKIPLPPLPEQKKIADILSTWDKAIETTGKLLANAEAQKRALMQQLLTGKRRLPGFEGREWRLFRLNELSTINPARQRNLPSRVTFIAMENVSERGEIFARQSRSADELASGYTPFIEGDVLVAKITPCFENGKGCHATDLENGVGFGSTEFHVLRANDPRDQRLLFHISNSHHFRGLGKANMTGSAGQKRVPADFLKSYSLQLPTSPDERARISSALDLADGIGQQCQTKNLYLQTEKRALMQQLLTGKRRVKL